MDHWVCMKQNYPKYRQSGQGWGRPENLKSGVIFSYALGTSYANFEQFPIKWGFRKISKTLDITIKVIFNEVPKVSDFAILIEIFYKLAN